MARIKSNAIGDDDEEYVKEKSLDFCKKQKLKEAILKSLTFSSPRALIRSKRLSTKL